jgi:hypothetical protein
LLAGRRAALVGEVNATWSRIFRAIVLFFSAAVNAPMTITAQIAGSILRKGLH